MRINQFSRSTKNHLKPIINPRRKIQNNKKNCTDYRMTMDGKIVDSILPLVSGCLVNGTWQQGVTMFIDLCKLEKKLS